MRTLQISEQDFDPKVATIIVVWHVEPFADSSYPRNGGIVPCATHNRGYYAFGLSARVSVMAANLPLLPWCKGKAGFSLWLSWASSYGRT
ncbi:hypothetical protein AVEN_69153-1, partial [Araneus ventricosus]